MKLLSANFYRTFWQNNKIDIIYLAVLSLFFCFVFLIEFKSFTVDLYDIGREVYVPQLILDGKILYKEVFMMYPPLGYLVNAVLYATFGQSFNVLILSSALNAFIVMILSYFISRQFVKPLFAFSITFTIIQLCIFCSYSVIRYILPYSFGMAYATSAFLVFILCAIIYLKSPKKPLYIQQVASLFLGISLACRFEFALCYIPYFIYLIVRKENLKSLVSNITCFLLPSFISFGFLFLQGLNLSDICSFFDFGKLLFQTPQQKNFLRVEKIVLTLDIVSYIGYVIYSVLSIFIIKHILKLSTLLKVTGFVFYLIFTSVLALLFNEFFFVVPFSMVCFVLIGLCIYKRLKKHKDSNLFTFLTACVLLISIRVFFLYDNEYSYFLGILGIILFLVFVFNSGINKDIKQSLSIFLITLTLQLLCLTVLTKQTYIKTISINSNKGSFNMPVEEGNTYKQLINWIDKNTNQTDSILMLPESPLINFITNRPTKDKYFQLLPNHIEAIGEEKIVKDLQDSMPNYIAIQKLDYRTYGQQIFGRDFGLKISELILNSYNPIEKFGNENFYIIIFKKK